jgi:hypothetical protein
MIGWIKHLWFMFLWKRDARQLAKAQKELDRMHERWMQDYD